MHSPVPPISDLIEKLSPGERRATRRFIELLLSKRQDKKESTLRQDWAGSLRKYRSEYTSLELQEKAVEWMSEE